MTTLRRGIGVVALAAMTACGDPREAFVGTWRGPGKTLVRYSDGSSETFPKGEVVVVIAAPERSNLLTFNGKCAMTATVNGEDAFTIGKKACPSERVTFSVGATSVSCDLNETISGGAGRRTDTSLSVSWFGESQLTRCTNSLNDLATYTSDATLSR